MTSKINDKLTSWRNAKPVIWLVDEVTSRWNDKSTKGHCAKWEGGVFQLNTGEEKKPFELNGAMTSAHNNILSNDWFSYFAFGRGA